MNARICVRVCAVVAVFGGLGVTLSLWAEGSDAAAKSKTGKPTEPVIKPENRVSVAAARERAKLMHEIYDATLDVMHRHYFRREGSVLPARAMEDVFAEIAAGSSIQARWISVNTKPMSINHEPETDFEKQAAKEISAGKADFELVENGFYQRAGRISLGGGCISCHTNQFASPSTSAKFAGLVIRIPVKD